MEAAGDNGQLGLKNYSETPVSVRFQVQIIQVAAGFQFSACLGENGCVFTFGKSDFGQLGLGDFENRFEPVCIPICMRFTFSPVDAAPILGVSILMARHYLRRIILDN